MLRPDVHGLAKAIVSTVRTPLLVLDSTLTVVEANPAFYRTFRRTQAETVGRAVHRLGDGEWDIPELRALLEHVLQANGQVDDFSVDHHFPTIGRRNILLNARRVVEHGNEPLILLALEDVTERQRVTAELVRSNKELERFAAVASHDLQEPVRKILAFGSRLASEAAKLSPDAQDHLRRMLAGAARLQRIIDDLLRYARVTARGGAFQSVELADIVAQTLEDLALQIERTGGRVEVTPLPAVQADPTQMRQLFQNLVANALKFRRPDVAPAVVVSADEPKDGLVRISVRDNGIGFEAQYADQIFDVFRRLHGRDEYEGTGIGLPLCRRIMQRHGGSITAHGVPGSGATFTVVLPIRQPTHGESP